MFSEAQWDVTPSLSSKMCVRINYDVQMDPCFQLDKDKCCIVEPHHIYIYKKIYAHWYSNMKLNIVHNNLIAIKIDRY